ncbi:peptidoglycan recognition protein family protein [Streptomyces sp. NPDC055210]
MIRLFFGRGPAETGKSMFGPSRRNILIGAGVGAAAIFPVLNACVREGSELRNGNNFVRRKGSGTRISVNKSPDRKIYHTEFPMTALGITWSGSLRGLKVRLFDKEGKAGEWRKISPSCPCGKDGVPNMMESSNVSMALVPAHNSFAYQFEINDDVEVVDAIAIDASSTSPSAGDDESKAPAFSAGGGSNSLAFPPPGLITRTNWGADEGKRFTGDGKESSPTEFFPVQMVTVHHTDTSNDDPDPAATVRAIYEQHAVANDWGDIGYNFLIDREGRIYEGRFSGEKGAAAHDEQGRVVTAFHTVGCNSGNIGIAMLGDFNGTAMPTKMREALVGLVASLTKKHEIDPSAVIEYHNPVSGSRKPGPTVGGHKDWFSTECPGGSTYADLEKIRADVAELRASRSS